MKVLPKYATHWNNGYGKRKETHMQACPDISNALIFSSSIPMETTQNE